MRVRKRKRYSTAHKFLHFNPCSSVLSVVKQGRLKRRGHNCISPALFYLRRAKINTMNFDLTEEQLMIRQAARDFAQNDCKPGVIERDTHATFPADLVKKMADLGFLGMMVDPAYGGGGMDTLSYAIAIEEISKVDASCSVIMSVNNSLVNYGLNEFGTPEQKKKYLEPLAKRREDRRVLLERARGR